MCKTLNVPRSTFYYKPSPRKPDTTFENAVITIFRKSRNNYGTRKIKKELQKTGVSASRNRIKNVMQKYNLISKYTIRNAKKKLCTVNEDNFENIVNRDFSGRTPLKVVVSDLTYIKVGGRWNYLCILLDLAGRRILGSAVGAGKGAKIVKAAFYDVKEDLRRIEIFHTDRGSEFKNRIIDDILKVFDIKRSLSAKGTPADNAVAEAMYSIIKTEFAFGKEFKDLNELKTQWFDYVNWYNNTRIHGSLGYLTPVQATSELQSFPD